ncbi:MAG: hypothetical protein HDS21_00205 [Bacteroides sp.]|nr:hypothetical protein [Bacteroides sp.]
MPTTEEIEKIAREYAEYTCPETDYDSDIVERNMDLHICADEALPVIEWLCERYCIVPKDLIRKEYKKAQKTHDIYTSATCINEMESRAIDRAEGRMRELTTLFGKSLFEEEKL